MAKEFTWVGKRITQPDAVAKATGIAKYTEDLRMPGLLIARVLRSPYPHARIKSIDKTKAEKLPGVEAVITAEDMPRIKFCCSFRDLPLRSGGIRSRPDQLVLADKARHVGDAIAAVAAINEDIAEEAINLIKVEYEILPAALNIDDALKPGAAKVHDDIAEGNISERVRYPQACGDVKKAFKESDVIVEGEYESPKQAAAQMEPQTIIASYDATGRLTIWSPCQLTHPMRREMAYMFDMPVGKVRVINPFVGGSFGTRLSISGEPICAALAMKTFKPVKLTYTKEDDFSVMETRTPIRYKIKMGFKKDGTMHAITIDSRTFSGAYLGRSDTVGVISTIWGMGNYRCPNRDGSAEIIYTNTTMSGAQRGYGNMEVSWGVEQVMDIAAQKLGMDPIELRMKNIKKVGEISNQGLASESTAQKECMEIGAKEFGWKEKRARPKKSGTRRYGIGMTCIAHGSGAHPALLEHSSAFIKMNEDGSASLIIHPGSPGTNIWGSLSQIAAEVIGIRPEDFNIVSGDTDVTLFDLGSHASRTTHVTGNAVLLAAQEVRREILKRAAKKLGVPADQLDAKNRYVFVKSSPDKRIPIAQITFDSIYNFDGECLSIAGKASTEQKWNSPPHAAFFVEVEVDTETGVVKVLKLISVLDSGTAINPMTVEGQAEGAVGFGMGFAFTENLFINQKTGRVDSANYTTYKIQGTLDMPDTKIILIEQPDPKGPFGAKGTAEPQLVGIAPAIANAIYDAVGVRITQAPITPEKILKALKEKP